MAGLLAVFALFHGLATDLGSDRGQAGLLIGGTVVLATVTAQTFLFGQPARVAAKWLGLGWPAGRGLAAAGAIALLLVSSMPLTLMLTGVSVNWYPGWLWLLPGLLAQAGVAEEILFRGYLFRHLRDRRSFWRAAALAMGPFVLVHLILFTSMPWPVALAAVALAGATTPPLAHLFELGGNTIWAPALVHFVMQATVKVVTFEGESGLLIPIVWMVACASLPYLVFLLKQPITLQETAIRVA
jgi:membrane protease YdiL (CAAX protease family)